MAIINPARPGQILDNGFWGARSNWNGDPIPGVPGAYANATTVPGDLGGGSGEYGFGFLAPLPQSYLGVPYNQGDTSGHLVNGGYNNLMDQIQDSLQMPSRYSQGWPWNNGAGRYAFATGQAYSPTAGRQAPWDLHPGGSTPPPGGGGGGGGGGSGNGGSLFPPPGGPFNPGAPGTGAPGPITIPPVTSTPPVPIQPLPSNPLQFPAHPPGYIDPETATPMPKDQVQQRRASLADVLATITPKAAPSVTQGIPANFGTSPAHPLGASATNNSALGGMPQLGNSYDEYTHNWKTWYDGLPTSDRVVYQMIGNGGPARPMDERAWQLKRAAEQAHPFTFG